MSEVIRDLNEAATVEWLKMQRQYKLPDSVKDLYLIAFKAGCLYGHNLGGETAIKAIQSTVNPK